MIYRGYGDAGDALSLFEKSSAKAFLPSCSPPKPFLELNMFNRATIRQGSFLPSFFSKKRKSRPPHPPINHNLKMYLTLFADAYFQVLSRRWKLSQNEIPTKIIMNLIGGAV